MPVMLSFLDSFCVCLLCKN